ncbi:hypothetical protein [Umezawaea sp.]|uniref:hypothetical protein n=1 Tax=Umezawaea sp. TaxID=1955258 RepID=UPI002ED14DC2
MRPNVKDTWATVLVIAAVALYTEHLELTSQPFLGDVRVVAAVCFALGVSAAAVGGRHRATDDLAMRVGAVLGTTATLLGVATLITAHSLLLFVFVLNIVGLWGFATLRHTGLFTAAMADDDGRAGSPRP